MTNDGAGDIKRCTSVAAGHFAYRLLRLEATVSLSIFDDPLGDAVLLRPARAGVLKFGKDSPVEIPTQAVKSDERRVPEGFEG